MVIASKQVRHWDFVDEDGAVYCNCGKGVSIDGEVMPPEPRPTEREIGRAFGERDEFRRDVDRLRLILAGVLRGDQDAIDAAQDELTDA